MEMLRRGRPLDLPPTPTPPIPQQYQPYRSKRGTAASDTGPSPLSQSSPGSLRRPPPTRGPPGPREEATVTTMTPRNRSSSVSNPTSDAGPRNSITSTTTTGSASTRSSATSLESDKNKPPPDPKAKVELDPDRVPEVLQRDPDVTPKIGQKKPKLKKVNEQIKPPELTHIPELLPIFTELLSGNLTQFVKRG